MIKQEFATYNLDGEEIRETYYFNITRTELIRVLAKWGIDSDDAEVYEDFRRHVDGLVADKDIDGVMSMFDDLLSIAVGIKSSDGKHLVKPDDIWPRFRASSCYSDLLIDLAKDSSKMQSFMDGILGADIQSRM